MIEYPSFTLLYLREIHDDYAEQFPLDSKTFLSSSICLMIDYGALQRIAPHFTRDATRINSTKINDIRLFNRTELPKHCYDYFPSLK